MIVWVREHRQWTTNCGCMDLVVMDISSTLEKAISNIKADVRSALPEVNGYYVIYPEEVDTNDCCTFNPEMLTKSGQRILDIYDLKGNKLEQQPSYS